MVHHAQWWICSCVMSRVWNVIIHSDRLFSARFVPKIIALRLFARFVVESYFAVY